MLLTVAIVLLGLIPASQSLSSGPPVAANPGICTSMTPTGHGASTASGSAPYTVTANAYNYTAGSMLSVTVEGTTGNTFRGLFVQARRVTGDSDVAIGTFSGASDGTQLLTCNSVANSAWGHSNPTDKSAATVNWFAPTMGEGTIRFRATVVKGPRNNYYENIFSANVLFEGATDSPTEPGATDSTTEPATTTSTSGPASTVSVTLATCALVMGRVLASVCY